MEQKYKERLLQVCRVLRELPPNKKFDLTHWYVCGTTGCAIGWSAADPWFRKRGLGLTKWPHQNYLYPRLGHATQCIPTYRTLINEAAVEEFFELTNSQVVYLFYPESYLRGNRQDVISRIESFVRRIRRK